MLSFVEEIVLLMLDDDTGRLPDLPLASMETVLAGAALMDLALRDRIDTDLERLTVIDPAPLGDDILDDALRRLAAAENVTVPDAVEALATHADPYCDQALARLVAGGILREDNGRFLWMFRRRRYPVVDDGEQREVRERLRRVVLTDEIPDPRDVVMICLVDACGLFGHVLDAEEQGSARPRIEQLRRMDLIGQAVGTAVAQIGFTIRHNPSAVF